MYMAYLNKTHADHFCPIDRFEQDDNFVYSDPHPKDLRKVVSLYPDGTPLDLLARFTAGDITPAVINWVKRSIATNDDSFLEVVGEVASNPRLFDHPDLVQIFLEYIQTETDDLVEVIAGGLAKNVKLFSDLKATTVLINLLDLDNDISGWVGVGFASNCMLPYSDSVILRLASQIERQDIFSEMVVEELLKSNNLWKMPKLESLLSEHLAIGSTIGELVAANIEYHSHAV